MPMITRLVLKNWKTHEDTTLDFTRGTNVLVGVMGAGKTAVLEAITYALFGTTPSVKQRRVKTTDLIMNRPNEKKEAEVELFFGWRGKDYSVKRVLKRKGSNEAELRESGKLVMGPQPEKVNEEVERVLKIDYDVFYRAVYSEQNQIDYFLNLQKGERKKQMDQLLGIDRFENARANVGSMKNTLKKLREEKEKQAKQASIQELREKKKVAEKRIAEAAERAFRASAAAEKAFERQKQNREVLDSLEKKKRDYEEHKDERTRLQARLNDVSEQLEKSSGAEGLSEEKLNKQVSGVADKKKAIEAKARELEEGLGRALSEKAGLESQLKSLKQENESRERLVKKIQELEQCHGSFKQAAGELEAVKGELEENKRKQAELGARAAEAEKALGELEKAGAKCPVCDRELTEEHRKRTAEEKKKEKRGLEEKALNAKQEEEGLRKGAAGLEEAVSELRLLKRQLEEYGEARPEENVEKNLNACSVAVEEKKRLLAGLREELGEQAEKKSGLEKKLLLAKGLRELKEKKELLSKGLADAEKKLAAIKFEPSELERVREEAGKAEKEKISAEAEARVAVTEKKGAEEALKEYSRELEAAEKLGKEVEEYAALEQQLSLFQNSLVQTQAALREELVQAINFTMAEVWPVVYPYGDYSEAVLKATEEDYFLELKSPSGWVPVEGVASGGERSCAALSLRIAFALVLVPNLKWIVLDEPTHNLDEQGIKALISVMQDRLPELVEQVFVITHEEQLKEAADSTVYRFERKKELEEATSVARLS